VDSIPAKTLRAMVRECIERHLDKHRLEHTKTIEEEERGWLACFKDLRHTDEGREIKRQYDLEQETLDDDQGEGEDQDQGEPGSSLDWE
jgi:hypothetical protein